MMVQLRSCSFNCRGWNIGVHTLNNITSLDICYVQEHWLLNEQLHKIHEISPDFLSVGVSGVGLLLVDHSVVALFCTGSP